MDIMEFLPVEIAPFPRDCADGFSFQSSQIHRLRLVIFSTMAMANAVIHPVRLLYPRE
jgi:hypothetical protein